MNEKLTQHKTHCKKHGDSRVDFFIRIDFFIRLFPQIPVAQSGC